MARTKSTICTGCGDRAWRDEADAWYADKYNGRYIESYTLEGKPVCNWCVENDRNHPNAIQVFDPGMAPILFLVGDYIVEQVEGWGVVEPDEVVALFGRPVWHSTDAWRGYNSFTIPEGYTSVGDGGWFTGWATEDDMAHKLDLYAVRDALASGEVPCRVWVLSCTTSNVFSQTLDIVVADEDVPMFIDWLREQTGLDESDLRYALS